MCPNSGPQELGCTAVVESRCFVGFERPPSEGSKVEKAQRRKIGGSSGPGLGARSEMDSGYDGTMPDTCGLCELVSVCRSALRGGSNSITQVLTSACMFVPRGVKAKAPTDVNLQVKTAK